MSKSDYRKRRGGDSAPHDSDSALLDEAGEEITEFHLAPPEGKSRSDLEWELVEPEVMRQRDDPRQALHVRRGWFQFSLGGMCLLMTALALGMAGASHLSAELFAGVVGGVTVLGLILIHVYQVEGSLRWRLMLSLTALYLGAAIAAAFKSLS